MSFTSASRAISIHAPREGSDNHRCTKRFDRRISIHAPREGSDLNNLDEFKTRYKISIHAPREGSDLVAGADGDTLGISIHAPREGSDLYAPPAKGDRRHFYPRSPRGERPPAAESCGPPSPYFYPRSPRGERPALTFQANVNTMISIHAPHEGSDATSFLACMARR